MIRLFFIVFLIAACQNQKPTSELPDTSTAPINADLITEFNTIVAAHAPSRLVRKVKTNSKGELLIASYEGIITYDGHAFKNISTAAGIIDCTPFDVLEDRQGNIWIASDQDGVFRINKTHSETTHFTTHDGLGHRRNMCIHEDRQGRIWVGGQGGLSLYDPDQQVKGNLPFKNYATDDGLTSNDINTVMDDREGRLWIGTRGTACLYDPRISEEGNQFQEIQNNDGQPFDNTWSIIEDRDGNIWLNSNGLWRYDGQSWDRITDMTGICIYPDRSGNLWFNPGHPWYIDAGLARIEAATLSKPSPLITDIFSISGVYLGMVEDSDGNLWIGGGDGIWCYGPLEKNDSQAAVTFYTSKQ